MFVFMSLMSLSISCSAAGVDIQEVLKEYVSLRHFKVHFSQQKHIKGIEQPLLSSGTLEVIRPDKVIWKVIRPSALQVELTSKEVKITYGEGKDAKSRVMGRDGNGEDSLGMLVAWLSLDAEYLKNHYEFKKKDKKMECIPKKPGVFKSLEFELGKNGRLKNLTILEKSNDVMQFDFSN